jgi:hypothetical protein
MHRAILAAAHLNDQLPQLVQQPPLCDECALHLNLQEVPDKLQGNVWRQLHGRGAAPLQHIQTPLCRYGSTLPAAAQHEVVWAHI